MDFNYMVNDAYLKGMKIIHTNPHYDERGYYCERFNDRDFGEMTGYTDLVFVQDGTSYSRKNVFRGFHGDFVTWKLVQCLRGEVLSVIVDLNPQSETYKKFFSTVLTESNFQQVLIPPGFGNSMLVLRGDVLYHYKQTTLYTGKQFTLSHKVYPDWPIDPNTFVMSLRDENEAALSFDAFEMTMKMSPLLEGNPFL